jgi:hypothetical protein
MLTGIQGVSGTLRNVANGSSLPVTLTITRSLASIATSPAANPNLGSPAATVFGNYIDFIGGTSANVAIRGLDWARYTLSGLDPNLRYSFRGTAIRGSPDYTNRWTLLQILGARSFESSHTAGCLTQGFGNLTADQVAVNTGYNLAGDMAAWDSIQPALDGTFSVLCTQYAGPLPSGTAEGAASGYALTALRVEEVSVPVASPPNIGLQPISQTVSEGSRVEFTVSGSAETALRFQWLKDMTPIAGANEPVLLINSANTNDVGRFNVILSTDAGSTASQAAVLSLLSINMGSDFGGGKKPHLEVVGPVGQRYALEYDTSLHATGAWTTLTNLTLPGLRQVIIDDSAIGASQRFYRAVPLE